MNRRGQQLQVGRFPALVRDLDRSIVADLSGRNDVRRLAAGGPDAFDLARPQRFLGLLAAGPGYRNSIK